MDPALMATICNECRDVPGDAVEFGVYQGASLRHIAKLLPRKTIHAFDSFQGMPKPGKHDGEPQGHFRANMEAAQKACYGLGNIVWHPGWFAQTTASVDVEQIAFAHVDCDHEQSYRDSLAWILPRLSPGGAVLFDDYGFAKCKGAKVACDEIFAGCKTFTVAGNRAVYRKPRAA